jgi:cobalt-zinc-cadmium efflux system protein
MGSGHWTDKDRFLAVLKINVVVFIIELLAGWYSGSLSMISDGFHVLLHVVVSLIALVSEYEFGGLAPDRIKLWSAGINIILFFPLAGLISYEAYKRLINPPTQNLNSVFFLVAFLGLAANIYTIIILHKGTSKQRGNNKNRPLLLAHMVFDAIGSVVVILGGREIYKTGSNFIDPKLSFVLSGLIVIGALWMSWKLFYGHDH